MCVCVWQGPRWFLPSNISRLAPPRMSDRHPGETVRKTRHTGAPARDRKWRRTKGGNPPVVG